VVVVAGRREKAATPVVVQRRRLRGAESLIVALDRCEATIVNGMVK
jgi:hypothetical protein